MSRGQAVYLTVLAACILMVSLIIRSDTAASGMQNRADSRFRFQQSIGGVGLGAVIVPAWNFSDFDPRLQVYGDDRLYPVPGGYSYSPDRLGMVTRFTAE